MVVPRLIRDLVAARKTLFYNSCMTQLFTAHLMAGVEIFILVSMALDRYVAIVKRLHYMAIMNQRKCNLLVMVAWIDHYICDVKPLLKLVCKDIHVVSILVIANSGMAVVVIFLVLIASYLLILYHLRTRSSAGRHKALSTCSSHVTVVVLFFVPCIYTYVLPAGSENKDKEISVFYTVVAPMLKSLIYTLRNMEMKIAMQKVWAWMSHR
ncbi:Olfactory receptor 4P4 [Sciurus carolinensis]|uniref:Olfactory receptor 4P4 n=1 Tax=Sciurus carolinensis TaxID=30640 RepID=A0AA41NG73_SCICA|nr:Olfactory receptor 4P4 [Sciurus carolinensis]